MHNASATLANLCATAERHALPLPPTFVGAADAICARYATPPATRDNLADLVAAAAAKGIDPLEDPAVRTALVRGQHGTTIAAALSSARENALAALLKEQATVILNGWHARFAELGAILASVAPEFPGTDLTRPETVSAAGTSSSRLTRWAEGHAVARELDAISGAALMLISRGRPDYGCLVGAPLTAAQYDELATRSLLTVPWSPCLVGVPLDLVQDQADLDRRAASVREERQRIAATKPARASYLMS